MAMELSYDLMEEILSRIPAKSLVRLKYTCKQWKTIIASPRFVSKHFSRLHGREEQFTLINDLPKDYPSPSGSIISCVGVDFNQLKKPYLNVEVLRPVLIRYLAVCDVFHCDGLLLYVMRNRLLVLNPLLKRGRWIKRVKPNDSFEHSDHVYGLGYVTNQSSSRNDYDYKMVRFSSATYCNLNLWVYDFKPDHSLKSVVDQTFDGFFGLPLSRVCLRGAPYWLGLSKRGSTIFSIQSFDFSKERFEPLFLPCSFTESIRWGDILSLGIFRGDHLSLLHESR